MTKISHSAPYVEKLNDDDLINIINSKDVYCESTVGRARRYLTTRYPNYIGVSHKLKEF
jgi:hypothetical protein